MLDKIRSFIAEYRMLAPGNTVVCGLSGGADSVCLLLALRELGSELGVTVRALHVDHRLRGAESDRDREFCRQLCDQIGVAFTAVSCDVRGFAAENKLSVEEAARELRYRIFREQSAGMKMATAHNADDNLETVLLNLTRGTALKGMAGIPPVRGNIIRPLLTVSRLEIEEFLAERGQSFVTDSTNLTEDYTRNKIRRRIIPVMREINPSLTATSASAIAGLRSENELIESQVDDAEAMCLKNGVLTGLSGYPQVIRIRCIARMLSRSDLPVSRKRLMQCDAILVNGGKLNISGDLHFISDGTTAELKSCPPDREEHRSAPLVIGENSIYPGIKLICRVIECDEMIKSEIVHKKLTYYFVDYDKIIGKTVVRSRKYGDRIQLRGRSFTSSVKKWINEYVPQAIRPTLHFIEDEEGTIFAESMGIADRVKPDENSRRLLEIAVCRDS